MAHAGHDLTPEPPERPDPAHVRRLAELADWHSRWVDDQVSGSPFHPDGRPADSDYNQHYVDLEADDGAFHRRAAQIMGLPQRV